MESTESKTKTKRKRVSKKTKRQWRKHSNIKDIEDFLEEQRVQERTGGLVAEKEDKDLFVVDSGLPSEEKRPKKKTKYDFRSQPLRCYENLLPNPHIPAVPKAKPRGDKRSRSANLPRVQNKLHGIFTPREAVKIAEARANRKKKRLQMRREDKMRDKLPEQYDIWSEGPKSDLPEKLKNADPFFLRYTKRTRRKVPANYYQKPTKISAVEVVDPGASYNPSFEDHQELLQKVYKDELAHLKKEKHLEQWSKGVTKWPAGKLEENYLQEMSAGLFEEEKKEEKKEEEEETDKSESKNEEDAPLPNPPATAEMRKTRKQRRIQALIRATERQRRAAKDERIRMNDVYRLKKLRNEIKKREEATARKRKKLDEKKEKLAAGTKKFGRNRFEDAPMAFKLSDELVGSLRQLQPEGSLIFDRYKNLQKRNLIEAKVKQRGAKRNLKEYVVKGHKGIK